MDAAELKIKLKEVDDLVTDKILSAEEAETWRENLIAEFKQVNQPQAPKKEMPKDLAHLPGRLVGKMIEGLGNMGKNMAQNTADRIGEIERARNQPYHTSERTPEKRSSKTSAIEIHLHQNEKSREPKEQPKKGKNIFDLPEMYR